MDTKKRILMECRYLLSIYKDYDELAEMFNVSKETIYNDLNKELYYIDKTLFYRVQNFLNNHVIIYQK